MRNSVFETPILFVVFNRVDTTARVLSRLKELKPAILYVSADGPRQHVAGEAEKCAEVKQLIEAEVDWPCTLNLNFRTENAGPGKGPAAAYDWFFSHEEEGIIIEDDSFAEISFFYFCAELLDRYRHDTRVFSINGNNFGYRKSGNTSYGFTHFMSAWGWATWKRSYALVDYTLKRWEAIPNRERFLYRRLNRWWDCDLGWVKFWEFIYLKVKADVNHYWDYQWMFTQVYHRMYSVFPKHNLVSNIGFTGEGTNLNDPDDPMANIPTRPMAFPLVHPKAVEVDRVFERDFSKKIWCYQRVRKGPWFYFKLAVAKQLQAWRKNSSK